MNNFFVARILIVAIVLINVLPAMADPTLQVKFGCAGPFDVIIENMPSEIRTVPPDYRVNDGGYDLNSTQLVGQKRCSTYAEIMPGLVWLNRDRDFMIGLGVNWLVTIAGQENGNNYQQFLSRNEETTRVKEVSFPYVTFKKHGLVPRTKINILDHLLAITPEISGAYNLEKFTLKGSISYFHLQAENGWGGIGNNDKKMNKIYDLGHYLPIFLGLQFGILDVGIYYPLQVSLTSLGKEADIKRYPTLFIGVTSCFEW